MSWMDNSEVIAGLLIQGRTSPNAYQTEHFIDPYDGIVQGIKDKKSPEEIIEVVGIMTYQSAIQAAENINGLGPKTNWPTILEKSYRKYQASIAYEKAAKRLRRGDDVDPNDLENLLEPVLNGKYYTPWSDVAASEIPFIKCGFMPFDKHIGGLPEVGLTIIAGQPGSGKTSLVTGLAGAFVNLYLDKTVIIHSLEMILPEIAMRLNETANSEHKDRVLLSAAIPTPEEVIARASQVENLGLVIIDFADLMIKGEVSEPVVGRLYRELMTGAKQLHCPVVLISQLARKPGIPRPNHIRWSGLAEALAHMIIMLYNPNTDWKETWNDDDTINLKSIMGAAYFLVWKVRGGFRNEKYPGPGAIAAPFIGSRGWINSNKTKWLPLNKD